MPLSLTHQSKRAAFEDWNHVQENDQYVLDAVEDVANCYRLVFEAEGFVAQDATPETFLLGSGGWGGPAAAPATTMFKSGAALTTANEWEQPPDLFYFASADNAVGTLTQVLRLRVQVACNDTAPGINFTFGLYPVTTAGAADTIAYTAGTVVPNSTVAINAPSGTTPAQNVSSDFTPAANGSYVLGVLTSGTIANNSAVSCHAQLQSRNV